MGGGGAIPLVTITDYDAVEDARCLPQLGAWTRRRVAARRRRTGTGMSMMPSSTMASCIDLTPRHESRAYAASRKRYARRHGTHATFMSSATGVSDFSSPGGRGSRTQVRWGDSVEGGGGGHHPVARGATGGHFNARFAVKTGAGDEEDGFRTCLRDSDTRAPDATRQRLTTAYWEAADARSFGPRSSEHGRRSHGRCSRELPHPRRVRYDVSGRDSLAWSVKTRRPTPRVRMQDKRVGRERPTPGTCWRTPGLATAAVSSYDSASPNTAVSSGTTFWTAARSSDSNSDELFNRYAAASRERMGGGILKNKSEPTAGGSEPRKAKSRLPWLVRSFFARRKKKTPRDAAGSICSESTVTGKCDEARAVSRDSELSSGGRSWAGSHLGGAGDSLQPGGGSLRPGGRFAPSLAARSTAGLHQPLGRPGATPRILYPSQGRPPHFSSDDEEEGGSSRQGSRDCFSEGAELGRSSSLLAGTKSSGPAKFLRRAQSSYEQNSPPAVLPIPPVIGTSYGAPTACDSTDNSPSASSAATPSWLRKFTAKGLWRGRTRSARPHLATGLTATSAMASPDFRGPTDFAVRRRPTNYAGPRTTRRPVVFVFVEQPRPPHQDPHTAKRVTFNQ